MSEIRKFARLKALGWSMLGLAWGAAFLGLMYILPGAVVDFGLAIFVIVCAAMLVWTWRPRSWHERAILGLFVVLTIALCCQMVLR